MIKRQFIAGASCQKCAALDKVRWCRDGDKEWIECVACGYVAETPAEPEHPHLLPERAVTASAVLERAVEESVVTIIRMPEKK